MLGNIALAFGDNDTALETLSQARNTAEKHGDTLEAGRATRSMGVVSETMTRQDDAQTYYEQSLELLSQVNDHMGMAGAYANLASVARRRGEYVQARMLYEHSLHKFETLNFAWGTAFTLTSLGTLLNEVGEYSEAKAVHTRAIGLCRDVGHQWGLAFCLSNLAQVCIPIGDYAEARVYLREGLSIAEGLKTLPLLLDMLTVYADSIVDDPALVDELYALVLAHPLTEPETLVKLRSKLNHEPTPGTRTLEEVISTLMNSEL